MLQAAQLTGLTTLRLVQLCQAEQIEETMRLLFALNHWAKARERLFFADRQGLYALKTAILRQAHTEGLLTVKAYIDGKEGFGQDLSFEIAADIAAEGFLWRLEELAAGFDKEREDVYERIVHRLYTRITDKQDVSTSDVEALETSQVHGYILACLHELEHEARTSGQPIPYNRLTELCIAPSDLLSIQDRRYYDLGDWYSWDELDASDLRKLDPEGLSLVAFDYTSPTAHYIFHLPLRLAEVFVPQEQIALLKRTPWTSRESGEYFGRAVTAAESLQQPITDILHELGADVTAICPRQLSDKQEILLFQHAHYSVWDDEEFEGDDEDEDDEEFDRDKALQMALYWHAPGRSSLVTSWPGPASCPSCSLPMDIPPGPARVEHWQNKHPGQDLTISQAGWMLDCTLEKKIFCQHYPPDYRAPHERGFGTRYWKVETLQAWINEKEETGLKR